MLTPLEQVGSSDYPTDVKAYFAHYGLDCEGLCVEHRFGSFESEGFTLAAHLFRPARSIATVVLLHGYLNHSGQFRHLIRHLLENNYAVAVYDLPGHGLSSGESAAIETFDQYVRTTQDFIARLRRFLNGPYHILGFSAGAAILIEMMIRQQLTGFEKVVLAGPLVHWAGYEQSRGTYKIYQKFTDKIARFRRKNSSDREFIRFNKTQDYLHAEHLSLRWVKALFDWNDGLKNAPVVERWLLLIQGDKDGTVDWRYNLGWISEKFPNAEIAMIAGANHELFNESPEYKQPVLNRVTCFLDQSPPEDAV